MVSTSTAEMAAPVDAIADSQRALVRRVLGSAVFTKSERLSSFLACVCDLTLTGRADEINEQKIGTTVFGRPKDYDCSVDGIVRTQASRLRQRLDLYFSGEGVDEPIRIVLPKGGYVPIFERQPPKELISDSPATPLPVLIAPESALPSRVTNANTRSHGSKLPWILVAVLSIAILAILVGNREASIREASATTHPLWSLLFRPDQRTMMVPGDSGLVLWLGVTKQKVGLEEYLSGNYRTESSPPNASAPPDAVNLANRRYTSIVDLDIAKTLSHIADSKKSTLEVRYARDVRPNDLKDGNVVFVGAATANPWVRLFEPNMDFVFFYDPIHLVDSVLNRAPTGSEPARWDSYFVDAQHRVYGVVAFLPNLSGKGNVLILEGTSMAGTECAWDFVADDSALLPFLDQIRRPDGTIPHFQLVLGTNNVSGSSVKSSILAWRASK